MEVVRLLDHNRVSLLEARVTDRLVDVVGSRTVGRVLLDVHSIEVSLQWTIDVCRRLYPRLSFVVCDAIVPNEDGLEEVVIATLRNVHSLLTPQYRDFVSWFSEGTGLYESGRGCLRKLRNGKVFNRSEQTMESPFLDAPRTPIDRIPLTVAGSNDDMLLLTDPLVPDFRMYAKRTQVVVQEDCPLPNKSRAKDDKVV